MTVVLHVVECWSAGVRRAVDSMVAATADVEHHLLWSGGEAPDEDLFSSTCRLPVRFSARVRAVESRASAVKADLIHAHSSWAGVYSRLRRLNVPVIYQPHCYKFDDPGLSRCTRWLFFTAEKLLAHNCAGVLVLSDHEERLAELLAPVPRFRVANAPTVATGGPTKRAGACRVAMIGRVASQKDPRFFAEVASLLRRDGLDLRFTWIGDGDIDQVSALRDAGVEVTGWVDSDGVARLLHGAIYLHTATYEGFPISVLDAAASGCPVLVRPIPAFRGLNLVEVETEGDAAAAVRRLATDDSYWDRTTASAMQILTGTSALERRRQLLEAYESVLHLATRPASSG